MKKLVITFLYIILTTTLGWATLPYYINYQGNLINAGVPVNGNHNMTFAIFDTLTSGNLKWQGELQSVHFTNGLFSCRIGEATALGSPTQFSNISWGSNKMYLQITIDGQTLAPREMLSSVPYAFYARHVENEMPPYSIVMYCGPLTQIPPGWALCDGRIINGVVTPVLTNMFIMGSANQADITPPGTGGGSDNISYSLSSVNIPQHNHSIGGSTGNGGAHTPTGSANANGDHAHTATVPNRRQFADATGDVDKSLWQEDSTTIVATSTAGNHSHTLTMDAVGNHTHTLPANTGNYGSNPVTPITFDNRPRFKRLAFIMKLP